MGDSLRNNLLMRGLLVGAALGLYFGLFFRPVRTPSVAFTLQLAMAATVVMVCIQAIRHRPPLGVIAKSTLTTFMKTAALLFLLDGRHLAFGLGGRTAATIYSMIVGAMGGLLYTYLQGRALKERN